MIRGMFAGLLAIALTVPLAAAQSPNISDSAEVDAMKALEAAEAAYQAAWDALPLTIRKGIFVEGPAKAFGSYVPREGSEFAPGEQLHLYVEPVGFGYRTQGRLNGISLEFDLALYDESGQESLFKQERFSGFEYEGRAKPRELYLNMEIAVTGIAAGGYVVGVTARDLVGGQTSEFRLPFRVGE